MDHAVSAIIPIRPEEVEHHTLIKQLVRYTPIKELIVSTSCKKQCSDERYPENVKIVLGSSGRAKQLNEAAKSATSPYLWFLHADTRINEETFPSLIRSIEKNKNSLHYFNLKFQKSSLLSPIVLNEIGAYARSHLLKLPFGDQGLCIAKDIFKKIGAFDESLKIAEDLNFVLRAKKLGVMPQCTDCLLYTSPSPRDATLSRMPSSA